MSPRPSRILMTLDAVGGVWRYALDLCKAMDAYGCEFVLVGLGPEPSEAQQAEAARLPNGQLLWLDEPLDWMAARESDLDALPTRLVSLADRFGVDLLHLNLPSQAARLPTSRPVVAVSHSCVATWWRAVKKTPLPEEWRWRREFNREGLDAADLVLVPSRSHADQLARCYGPLERLRVVPNATTAPVSAAGRKESFVFAAGRWWDEGKNGLVLDAAAASCRWPVLMAGACRNAHGQSVTLSCAQALGERPHHEVADLMARAAIVVSPSLYEPFGLVALEAARAGAALVLADIRTYRELWDGAALFADARDPAAFANALDRLGAGPALRAELGAEASRRAQRFSLEAQAGAVLDAYRAAAAHAERRQPASAA